MEKPEIEYKVTYLVFTNENRYHCKEEESEVFETSKEAEKSAQEKVDCYGFILHTRKVIFYDNDTFNSQWQECKKVYFGEKYSPEQIADEYPNDTRLIKLAKIFGGMIKTRTGNWAANDPDFMVIEQINL